MGKFEGALRQRVLIADDHEDSRESLEMLMTALGYEARAVADGESAVREALSFRPAIAILDIGMPRMSGYDAAQLIRKSLPGNDMILIAFSGWARPQDVRLSKLAGMDAHLVKPLVLDKLLEVLKTARKSGLRARPRPRSQARPHPL